MNRMKTGLSTLLTTSALLLACSASGRGAETNDVRKKFIAGTACPGNDDSDVMVKVGPVCVDVYEASIWDSPSGGNQLLGDLGCSAHANDCTNVFARSVEGITPRGGINWFQAQQACKNAGKRLLSNAEWQMAVAGTPDPDAADDKATTCNTATFVPNASGSRSQCVSNHGVYDMVGNMWEWVEDWQPLSGACAPSIYNSGDANCLAGAAVSSGPGALLRGGWYGWGPFGGVFSVFNAWPPDYSFASLLPMIGFRCAR